MALELLGLGWDVRLREMAAVARKHVSVCAPFVTQAAVELLTGEFSRDLRDSGELRLVVDLSPHHIIQDSLDPSALQFLLKTVGRSQLTHLPRLHSKIYIFDDEYAIVTSANLTAGGLFRNFECGLGTDDPRFVRLLRAELDAYVQLGADIEPQRLERYRVLADSVREKFGKQLRAVSAAVRAEFQNSIREAEDELIRARTREGAVTPLFVRTIVYLLKKHGPLTTKQLQPLIQIIHPDLCDDSVDRVIDDAHFGKKWKHWVRSAQQRLKDEKKIMLTDGRWMLRATMQR
jgi:hypothetical protein